ncbi:hypothetical protein SPRG_19824 [Saprolegnia parasitica CBS 223.65]|uniref:Poly(A) RNA polymerase mitochondrial-like central palm domain-containing protein n=1 Tax=Saprolegnia parasitica (strain CBS 223.65) TaxID=695850 RepID=A0A067CM33_SAPPC|nr:hypothetical protein SPRG_19824 [Saprolegnia parasitica CBS 223.65]KDO30275.1 hypothetical protein SPRG_19824 [Saprolegnia parasitica CBS 223.65]|eukprot:XP_012199074.1 hypothetical protein SPRG_19824 [Saprolegnia parasitica CBS 223.65]
MARNYHAKYKEGGRKRRPRAASPSSEEDSDDAPVRKKAKRAKPPTKAKAKKRKPLPDSSSDASDSSDDDDEEDVYLHIQNGSGLSTAVKQTFASKKLGRGDRHLRSRHLWPVDPHGAPWLLNATKPISISEEIHLFAKYVRMQPLEAEARRVLSKSIMRMVETHMAPTPVAFDHFGSLAPDCESRATFRSDIDLSMERAPEIDAKKSDEDASPDSTDDSSSYEDERDPSGSMSFNFASAFAPNAKEIDGPSKESRAQQARFLTRASVGLRQGDLFRVHVRGRAKVPIINLVHHVSKLEVDISMGVDKTSVSDQVIQWFAATYPVFNPVIVLLKEFLHQSGLNKPFEGGLGSYRLYVMVGHVINIVDEPSNAWRVLNLFFEYFSGAGRFQTTTVLRLQIPRTNLRCEAEFKSIFRLRECNTLFALAAETLRSAIKQSPRAPSVLASIFCTVDLREDRDESVSRANAVLLLQKAPAPKAEPKKEIKDLRFGKRHVVTSAKKLKKLQTKSSTPFPRAPMRTQTIVVDYND